MSATVTKMPSPHKHQSDDGALIAKATAVCRLERDLELSPPRTAREVAEKLRMYRDRREVMDRHGLREWDRSPFAPQPYREVVRCIYVLEEELRNAL